LIETFETFLTGTTSSSLSSSLLDSFLTTFLFFFSALRSARESSCSSSSTVFCRRSRRKRPELRRYRRSGGTYAEGSGLLGVGGEADGSSRPVVLARLLLRLLLGARLLVRVVVVALLPRRSRTESHGGQSRHEVRKPTAFSSCELSTAKGCLAGTHHLLNASSPSTATVSRLKLRPPPRLTLNLPPRPRPAGGAWTKGARGRFS
jgi:hypothetical protein